MIMLVVTPSYTVYGHMVIDVMMAVLVMVVLAAMMVRLIFVVTLVMKSFGYCCHVTVLVFVRPIGHAGKKKLMAVVLVISSWPRWSFDPVGHVGDVVLSGR